MDAIVHIGTPKTGSSSLQAVLGRHREALRAQGILYPEFSRRKPDHGEVLVTAHYWADSPQIGKYLRGFPRLRDKAGYAKLAEAFDRTVEQAKQEHPGARLLISCEMLGMPFRSDRFIRAFCDNMHRRFDRIEVLIYLRAQDRWMISEYSQRLKNGQSPTLSEFLSSQRIPDYASLVARWEKAISPGKLTVRLFDPERLADGDIVADFCDALSLDLPKPAEHGIRNQTLSARGAGRVRRLNIAARRCGDSDGSWAITRGLRQLLIRTDRPTGGKLRLPAEEVDRIARHAAPSNERLRASHFPHLPQLFSTMPAHKAAA